MDEPTRNDLPVPDYDQLPLGSLQHRIRSLNAEELALVEAYERSHANRPAAITFIESRLHELRAGAHPSGGSPGAAHPETAPPPDGGSGISPETAGPPINPPSHGTPANPAQPRT